MPTATYAQRRDTLEDYFDRTAADAWKRLTSDAPVGKIRATVRAGRDRMRATLLGWLPSDLAGRRLLDAGCGTGALSVEAAARGAQVLAIDVAGTLVALARERAAERFGATATATAPLAGDTTGSDVAASYGDVAGSQPFMHFADAIDWRVGDMLDPSLGSFDHVVAMDSLIHYREADVVRVLGGLAERTRHSIVFTFAPRTPALSAMHAVGKLFPRGNRAPAIEPVAQDALARAIGAAPGLADWRVARTLRIDSGFYTSQALELVRR